MKIIDPGHLYEVEVYDGGPKQIIQFMKRTGSNYPGNTDSYGGTNIQELMRVIIDRIRYVDRQKSHPYNNIIIQNEQHCLSILESRAFEMNPKRIWPHFFMGEIEKIPTCPICGHITCLNSRNINDGISHKEK